MQTLYEWDFRPKTDISVIKDRNIQNYHEEVDDDYINQMINKITTNLKEIDNQIIKSAPEWPLEQIAGIDKTILRIAIGEILYRDDIPPKVIINEAVELGKNFGGENSSKFINGVLGTVYRQSSRYNPKDDEKEEVNKKEEENENQ